MALTAPPRIAPTAPACDWAHNHVPCVGRDTLFTQGCTPSMCKVIHKAIRLDLQSLASTGDGSCQRSASKSQSPCYVMVAIDVLSAVDHSNVARTPAARAVCALTVAPSAPAPMCCSIRGAWNRRGRRVAATSAPPSDVEQGILGYESPALAL